MIERTFTYRCPSPDRGERPLERVAGLPQGVAAGLEGAVFTWRRGERHAAARADLAGLGPLMHLAPIGDDLLVACCRYGVAGVTLEGGLTGRLTTEHWSTLRPLPGRPGVAAVLGDDGALVTWSVRGGEVLDRRPLGAHHPPGYWKIVALSDEVVVLLMAPDASYTPAGVVALDAATGAPLAGYRGEDGAGLLEALWLGGDRLVTVERSGLWRLWRGGLEPAGQHRLAGLVGGAWLGGDAVLTSIVGAHYGALDVATGAHRKLAIRHHAAGLQLDDGRLAIWRTSPPYRPVRGKGALYIGGGPGLRFKKVAPARAVRFAAPLGGALVLLSFEPDAALTAVPLDTPVPQPIAALSAPVIDAAVVGAAPRSGPLMSPGFSAGLAAAAPQVTSAGAPALLLLHEGEVASYSAAE